MVYFFGWFVIAAVYCIIGAFENKDAVY